MSYSIQKLVSDGTLSVVVLGVAYLQRNDIYMRIAGVETPQSGAPSGYTWSFVDNSTLRILPVVPVGVEVTVYRRTDFDSMYNVYSQNAQFDESTIDENNQQLLYIAQEYFEQGIPGASIEALEYVRATDDGYYYRFKLTDGSYTPEFLVPISPNTKLANRAMWTRFAAESGYVLAAGDFETGGVLLNNTQVLLDESTQGIYSWSGAYPEGGKVVAAGTGPTLPSSGYVPRTDVVLRGQLASSAGSELVYTTQSAVDAAVRTIRGKLNDRVSVYDFGAVSGADISSAVAKAVAHLTNIGGGELDFCGITATCSSMVFSGISNIEFNGHGAKITKIGGSPGSSLIFNFKGGSSNIIITGFAELDGGYDGSVNPSTGGDPVILVGDQSGSGDGGLTNKNIHIFRNNIKRSNWAGVVVYGRSNNDKTLTPHNEDVFVYDNEISYSSNGAFIYKNAVNVKVWNNRIHHVGQDGVIFDTMAATDSVTSESITGADAFDNKISFFGMLDFGVGVLFKGSVNNGSAVNNTITDGAVNSLSSKTNYAINVSNDSNPTPTGPTELTLSLNSISRIASSQANGGYGINVSGVASDITIEDNSIDNTSNHAILVGPGASDISVLFNKGYRCGNSMYAFRFEGTAGNPIKNILTIGNSYKQDGGSATGGFYHNYADVLVARDNRANDFTTSAQVVSNCTNAFASRQYSGTSAPTVGTYRVGDIYWNTSPTYSNPVSHWICTVAGTPGTWKPGGHLVTKSTTANRPALRADDVGVMYMDSTLVAAGKPIWWTGTSWVDATGASV